MSLIDTSDIKQTISNLLVKFSTEKERDVIKRDPIVENGIFSVIENQDVLGEYYSEERNQYFHIFKNRFKTIRSRLITMSNRYGSDKMIDDIASLNEFKNQQLRVKITVAGILIKDVSKRPNILKDIDTYILNKNVEKFNCDKDVCFLEGETGRIKLKFLDNCKIKENGLCTGLIVSLVGYVNEFNVLEVGDMFFPYNFIKKEKILKSNIYENWSDTDNIIAMASDLGFGMTSIKNNLSFFRNNLIQLFAGNYFNNSILNKIISKVETLFVFGNLIHPHENAEEYDRTSYVKSNLNKEILKYSSDGMKQADDYLDQLSKIVSLCLLPGELDATNACFPQEKFKSFTLNKSSNNSNFTLLDNPSILDYRNLNIAITSGQNIKSMMKYTDYSPIDSILINFNSSHYAINSPDDLRCYPFKCSDPLLIQNDEFPDVYFAGGSNDFEFYDFNEESINKHINVVLIPKFSEKHAICLYNLSKNECFPIFLN